jgi:hypothetical protein
VPLYKPFTTHAELPRAGDAFETSTFDMKQAIHPRTIGGKTKFNKYELAKDVAMFANASGGTILVGAKEDGATGRLEAYYPLTAADAKALADAFEDAVKSRCYPRTTVDCAIIPYDTGVVLAVNVAPFPGQAVAVRVKGEKEDGHGGDAYVFPLRTGRDCSFITPEQLPMLMLPALRHAVIRLSQISQQFVAGEPERGLRSIDTGTPNKFSEYSINEAGSTVTFKMIPAGTDVNVPLDFIGPVWRSALGPWIVQLYGCLRGGGDKPGDVYQFEPLFPPRP